MNDLLSIFFYIFIFYCITNNLSTSQVEPKRLFPLEKMAVARCTDLAIPTNANEDTTSRQLLDGPQNNALVISTDR